MHGCNIDKILDSPLSSRTIYELIESEPRKTESTHHSSAKPQCAISIELLRISLLLNCICKVYYNN
jgi:hypothetical protein